MEITPIPCLTDNYAYIICDNNSKTTAVVADSFLTPKPFVFSIPVVLPALVIVIVLFKEKPDECPCCQSKKVVGIEVLGAYKGTLLWQCMKCSERYLRFDKVVTNKLLEEVKDSYTVPEDWGYLSPDEFS